MDTLHLFSSHYEWLDRAYCAGPGVGCLENYEEVGILASSVCPSLIPKFQFNQWLESNRTAFRALDPV